MRKFIRQVVYWVEYIMDEDNYDFDTEPAWQEPMEWLTTGIAIGILVMGILMKNTYGL